MKSFTPQLVYAGHNHPRGAWRMPSHAHRTFEMILVTAGHEHARVGDYDYTAETGEIFLFTPGVAHSEWSHSEPVLETYFVAFTLETMPDIAWPLHSTDHHGRLRQLARWLFELSYGATAETVATRNAFLAALLLEFNRLTTQREHPLLGTVRQYIRAHIAHPFPVGDLAQCAGMSKYHFIRHYREMAGITPMADARMIRLGFARDLILTSDLPLKAIAARAGLGDEIALYHLFRRHLQMTPGQLRRTMH